MRLMTNKDGAILLTPDAAEDVHVVYVTREAVRLYLDDQSNGLPEDVETALDLAQSESTEITVAVVLIIERPE